MDTDDDVLKRVAEVENQIAGIKKTAAYQYQALHGRLTTVERKLLGWGGLGAVAIMLVEKFL